MQERIDLEKETMMMKLTFPKRFCVTITVFFIIFTGLLTVVNDVYASHSHKKGDEGYPGYAAGRVVDRLPAGHHSIWVHKQPYFYHGGVFYRRGPSGFVVVRAPIGAIIANLPLGYRQWVVGGTSYYGSGGVYYRRVPAGYEVVEAPAINSPGYVEGERVWVSIPVLNVRSGPGMDHQVVRQVNQGVALFVREYNQGWLYVELPDGQSGWVMRQFTAPQYVRAGG